MGRDPFFLKKIVVLRKVLGRKKIKIFHAQKLSGAFKVL
jgi:hypothetical protein